MVMLINAKAVQCSGCAMLRLRNGNANIIKGLIAQKELDCLKALLS